MFYEASREDSPVERFGFNDTIGGLTNRQRLNTAISLAENQVEIAGVPNRSSIATD